MINIVATQIVHDTRRPLKDGSYPVKLRITHQRNQKYYPLGVSLSKDAFARTRGENPRGEYKQLQLKFNAVEQRARAIIDRMEVYTEEGFEKQFFNSVTQKRYDVFSAFEAYIETLKSEGRIGTAITNGNASRSLQAFHTKKILPFATVTPEFLRCYERWMLDRGRSSTTIGFYLRALKAIYNIAIADGMVDEKLYPFGRRKFVVPSGNNVKKNLSLQDIKKIVEYEPQHDSEARARDLWFFSYLNNGANINDIALLKYKNIKADSIVFNRIKSIRTKRQNLKPIIAALVPESEAIIEKWGNKPVLQENFVFPILTEEYNLEQQKARVKQTVKSINMYMKRIAKHVGLEHNPTTYWARHSYSTATLRAGGSLKYISDSLGHSSVKVTESYLASFETEEKKRLASKLTAFDN